MKQPKALPLLFFVQMWECFSFYGMRALLVLYMLDVLLFSQQQTFGVYAVYTAMAEMFVLIGGFLADKVFGLRASIFLGGALIACGHLCLAFSSAFFLSLALIVVGSSLFKTNLKALLGLFYKEGDPKREAGFTFFYSGMNLGGFLATLLCGYIGHFYGWDVGFGLAAAGMLVGLIVLVSKRALLEDKGKMTVPLPKVMQIAALIGVIAFIGVCCLLLQNIGVALAILPLGGVVALIYLCLHLKFCSFQERKRIFFLLGMIALLMVYFVFEELMGSLLMVFANTYVSKTLLGFQVPTSVLLVMNPLTIILLGPVIAKIKSTSLKKVRIAFLCLSFAFALLAVGAMHPVVSPVFLLCSFFAIGLGELLIAPVVYAVSSQCTPMRFQGMFMSLVTMGFGYGSLISGTLSQKMHLQALADYREFFLIIMLFALAVALILFLQKIRSASAFSYEKSPK